MVSRPSQLESIAPLPSPEEAAAIAAALDQFMRATAAAAAAAAVQGIDPWQRAAILEGVERERQGDGPDPWINT